MALEELYRAMARARAVELALAALWARGLVSGELHLGTGEEAIAAGVAAHLRDGDAVALDHRGTPMMVLRGVDLGALVRELLGREDGLCRGRGGHMHLLSRAHLAASSGIVGASAPLGAGFALAARRLRPGSVAVALLGDGAMNQGMVLETLNLAAAWRLPLVVVCKDNGWAITTATAEVTGGGLLERARAFGLAATTVDGRDVEAVHQAAGAATERARRGEPAFLHAECTRLDGHFLGDLMVRVGDRPLGEGRAILRRVVGGAVSPKGASARTRAASLTALMRSIARVRGERRDLPGDPLVVAAARLRDRGADPEAIDRAAAAEVDTVVAGVLAEAPTGSAGGGDGKASSEPGRREPPADEAGTRRIEGGPDAGRPLPEVR